MSEKKGEYPGILPLTGYNYVLPFPDCKMPINQTSTWVWPLLWHPGYGLFKYKVEQKSAPEGWDYAVIEMGGMYHSMYDFCGGLLTSSLHYNVTDINHTRSYTGWGDRYSQHFRAPLSLSMPPLLPNDSKEALVDTTRYYTPDLSPSIYSDSGRSWLATYRCFTLFHDYIPDAEPYLGPGLNLKDLQAVARDSVFAWLMYAANSNMRTAVFAADRTDSRPTTRNCLKLGSVSTALRYRNYPHVGISFDARETSETAGKGARVWPNWRGAVTPVKYTRKARFYGGRKFRNRNSGNNVAMSNVLVPSGDTAGYFQPAEKLTEAMGNMLTNINYIRLFPNYPFHNG